MAEAEDFGEITDLKENFLKCSVCLQHFDQAENRPRLLGNCFHAFCTQCLEKLLKKEGRGQVTCPNCRQVQEVKGTVENLPVDPVRNKLVDYVQFKKNKRIPCTDCPDGSHAVVHCHDCQIYMCKHCKEAHYRNRPTRNHICQSLKDALREPIKIFLSHFCKDHLEYKIEFYCLQCSSLCCVSCFVLKHKNHNIVPLQDAGNSMLLMITNKIEDVEKSEFLLRKKKTSLDKECTKQEFNLMQTKNSINQKFDELICQLNSQRSNLINEIQQRTESSVNGLKKQREETEHRVSQIESALEYFKQMESTSDDYEILSAGPVFFQSLEAAAAKDQFHDFIQPTWTFLPGEIDRLISNPSSLGEINSLNQEPSSSPKPEPLIDKLVFSESKDFTTITAEDDDKVPKPDYSEIEELERREEVEKDQAFEVSSFSSSKLNHLLNPTPERKSDNFNLTKNSSFHKESTGSQITDGQKTMSVGDKLRTESVMKRRETAVSYPEDIFSDESRAMSSDKQYNHNEFPLVIAKERVSPIMKYEKTYSGLYEDSKKPEFCRLVPEDEVRRVDFNSRKSKHTRKPQL